MANNKDVKRGVVLYLDGKEVEKSAANIQREMRKVKKEIDSCTIGSKEYVEATKKYKELNRILTEHKNNLRGINEESKSLGKNISNAWGKMVVGYTAVAAAVAKVVSSISEFRDALREQESSAANLKALTGLDDNSIAWLTEQAQTLSTTMDETGLRVTASTQEILDAYMLVGSAKPELLSDKEALNAVTIEAMRLAQAAKMDLKDAVNGVTLALNQYGASANEAAKYVNVLAAGSKFGAAGVESQTAAVVKAGVAASQANIPIEQLVGSIETLAEKGIKDEVAGTGLKTFFLKLESMSRDVRPSVVGLQTALENLQKKGMSTKEMQKQFGLEAYTVAAAMIDGADKVKQYTEAVTDTNTAMEQAAINSDTTEAKMAQMRNEYIEQGKVLAQELNPAVSAYVQLQLSSTTYAVKLIQFMKNYKSTLTVLTVAFAAYYAWKQKDLILDKLKVFWNGMVLNSLRAIRIEMMKNPYALAAVAIATMTVALIEYNNQLKQSLEKTTAIDELNKKVKEDFDKEAAPIEVLTKKIHDNNLSLDARKDALARLKEIVPDYHADLTEEGKLINDNTSAIDDYLTALEKQIRLKAAQEELEEKIREKRKKERELQDAIKKQEQAEANQKKSANSVFSGSQGNVFFNIGQVNSATNNVSELRNEVQKLNKDIQDLYDETNGGSIIPASSGGGGGGNTTETEDDKERAKRIKKETDAIKADIKTRQNLEKQKYIKGQIDKETYNQRMEELELEGLRRQLKIRGLEPEKIAEIEEKVLDYSFRARQALNDYNEKGNGSNTFWTQWAKRFKDLEKQSKEEVELIEQNKRLGTITEEEYNAQILQQKDRFNTQYDELTREYVAAKEKALNDDSENMSEFVKKLEDAGVSIQDIATSIGNALGEDLGKSLKEGSLSIKDALKDILKIMITAIEKVVVAEYAAILATEIASKSWAGIATAAAKLAVITAAFETAKAGIDSFDVGGYTGQGRWNQTAGVVHNGEFVANRYAVSNPAVKSVLDVIDAAQRSGTVSNLTSQDLASVSQSSASASSASGSKEMIAVVAMCSKVMAQLKNRLDEPIVAQTYVSGKGGINEAQDLVEKMKKNIGH